MNKKYILWIVVGVVVLFAIVSYREKKKVTVGGIDVTPPAGTP